MYLDVYVYNKPVISIAEIDKEETLPEFPPWDTLMNQIRTVCPEARLVEQTKFEINIEDFQGFIDFGPNQKETIIYFKIYGGKKPVCWLLDLCKTYGWSAYTPENETIIQAADDCEKYWNEYLIYQQHIQQVFYKKPTKKKWWQLWK